MNWRPIEEYVKSIELSKNGSTDLLSLWIKKRKIIRYTIANPCIDYPATIKAGRKKYYFKGRTEAPPFLDHGRLFKGKDRRVWLAYHSYYPKKRVKELVIPWARKKGLTVSIYGSNKSWYYPGKTCLVIMRYRPQKERAAQALSAYTNPLNCDKYDQHAHKGPRSPKAASFYLPCHVLWFRL